MQKVVGARPSQVTPKTIRKNGTNCLPAWHTGIGSGVWQ